LLFVFAAFLAAFPIRAAAQCFSALPGLGAISGLTGNPFQAEVKHTENTSPVRSFAQGPQRVARDTQGRVRTEWSAGKYKVQNGPDAGAEVEQRHITICDPVKGESISLDTLNKTATIQKVNFASVPPIALPATTAPPSFCSRQFRIAPNIPTPELTDLGHRTIEGMDAQGVQQRRTTQLQGAESGDATGGTRQLINVTETWCSEELGTIILRVIGTEKKSNTQTIAMVNIQRGEPDATLFQIPPGYRILERVNDPASRTGTGIISGFSMSSPAEQIVIPDKP
jgi:hypothetical protein